MDSNSTDTIVQTPEGLSSTERSAEEPNNKSNKSNTRCESTSSADKPEAKERSRFKTVESRYKQSTQQWVNRRSEDSNSSQNTSRGTAPRNPTPERKKLTAKKASTPLSTDKSLNCTGVSAINSVIDQKDNKPVVNLKKYGKALGGRKSIAPKRLPFDPEVRASKSAPLTTSGLENQTRNKEFEDSVRRSLYLQTLYLNLKAKQALTDRRDDAINKMSAVWRLTNEIRSELTRTQEYVISLETLVQKIDDLEKQKTYLEQYSDIRSKVDPLFIRLSQLIGSQKKLIQIENCSEQDFHRLSGNPLNSF